MAAVIVTNLAEHFGETHEPGYVLGSIGLSLGFASVAQSRVGPGVCDAKEAAPVMSQS